VAAPTKNKPPVAFPPVSTETVQPAVPSTRAHIYITTPLYYVNAEPHLGSAYTIIICDTIARFHRQRGAETFFLTGTDEHGDKIAQAAEAAGESPKTYADRISDAFRHTWEACGL